jgi:hypothetical protein
LNLTKATDTLAPYGIVNATGYYNTRSSNGGYVAGVNGYGDLAKAQEFPVTNGYDIEGFLVWVGKKEIVGTADDVTAALYDMDGTGNTAAGTGPAPGTVVVSVTLNMDTDVDTAGDFTPAMFTTPIARWTDYAVGLDFSNMDDTLGIVHSNDGDANNNELAWEQWSDGSWYTFLNTSGWGMDLALAFLPVVDMGSTDIQEHDFVNGIRMESYPNPAVNNVTVDFEILETSDVTLNILDMSGRIVKTVELGSKTQGAYNINVSTENLESGMYFYMLEAGNNRLAKRMMIK